MNRRDFTRNAVYTVTGPAFLTQVVKGQTLKTKQKLYRNRNTPFVGIQLDPEAVQHRDPEELCEEIIKRAPINTLIYFYRDADVKRGESYRGQTDYYCDKPVVFEDGSDRIDRLGHAASARDMGIYLGGGELYWDNCLNRFPDACQIDCFGNTRKTSCYNKPDWRAFQKAAHVDLIRQHPDLKGFIFMHERTGPFGTIFKPDPWQGEFNPGCFCEHCCRLGQQRSVSSEKARKGFQAIVAYFRDKNPSARRDGVMVGFWRLLCDFPEVLAWESLQWDTLHAYRGELADAMRNEGDGIQIGCHIQHSASTADLPWRAGADPEKIKRYADWVKPSVYPGCSGRRYKNLLDKACMTYLGDCNEEAAHLILSAWFQRDPENGRRMLGSNAKEQNAFGPDWVETEVRRVSEGCAPLPVYAGLGIGVPGGEKADTVELIAACTEACYRGGADGILISRHYSEMLADQLRACGDVIRKHCKKQDC